MAKLTLQQFNALLARLPDETVKLLQRLARMAGARIAGRAIGTHILPGPGGPVHPTKITSRLGRLVRALAASRGRGAVEEVEWLKRLVFRLVKGADADAVPEVLHERGIRNAFGRGIRIPARPFLAPALADERGEIIRRGQTMFFRGVRALLAGGPA